MYNQSPKNSSPKIRIALGFFLPTQEEVRLPQSAMFQQ